MSYSFRMENFFRMSSVFFDFYLRKHPIIMIDPAKHGRRDRSLCTLWLRFLVKSGAIFLRLGKIAPVSSRLLSYSFWYKSYRKRRKLCPSIKMHCKWDLIIIFLCRRTVRCTNLSMEKSYRYEFWIRTAILIASKLYCFQKRSANFFAFLIET
jgi:hypothetical protein